MVTYEELARMKVIGPRPAQIRELLKEKPMNAQEVASTLGVTVAAVRPHLRDLSRKDADVDKTRFGRNVYYFVKSKLDEAKKAEH
ncbi:MAG: winged helix-turn-helix domain-containing protein [Candidatus Bathyarchaeia archaeon]